MLVALVKPPLGLLRRPDTVFLVETGKVVYLRITNALPLRAPAEPCLKLCSVLFRAGTWNCLPSILGLFDLQVPEPISLVQQVLFKWNATTEFAPPLLDIDMTLVFDETCNLIIQMPCTLSCHL